MHALPLAGIMHIVPLDRAMLGDRWISACLRAGLHVKMFRVASVVLASGTGSGARMHMLQPSLVNTKTNMLPIWSFF